MKAYLEDNRSTIDEVCKSYDECNKKCPLHRFIDHYKDENVVTKYHAGTVVKYGSYFIIVYEMEGAKKTFSIGQPVYDKDNNLMGYLGIGLYENLDYGTEGKIRIPVEHWMICLPTKYCIEGKTVYTYWQFIERQESEVSDADSN